MKREPVQRYPVLSLAYCSTRQQHVKYIEDTLVPVLEHIGSFRSDSTFSKFTETYVPVGPGDTLNRHPIRLVVRLYT